MDRDEAGKLLMECNATVVENRRDAHVYLVVDGLNPGQGTTWYAMLGGRTIVEFAALQPGKVSGLIVDYGAPKVCSKVIHVSQSFKENHAELANAVIDTCKTSGRAKDAAYKLGISAQGRTGNGWYTKSSFLT